MNARQRRGYHESKALSKSAIDLLLECPAHYKVWQEDVHDETETKALIYGSAFHKLCLEPESFDEEYAVTGLNLTTKAGREWKASLAEDITIIKEDEYEQALMMVEAIREHPQAKYLFGSYEAEKPIYWNRDGIECKAKPDLVSTIKELRYCVDVKTTESADPRKIAKSIADYKYYRQAPWYLDGLEAVGKPCEAFLFIFVEKKYPHLVTMCQLDEAALSKGREECARAVDTLKECQRTGIFPCYTKDILTISLPKWAA